MFLASPKGGHVGVKGSSVHQKPLGHLQKGWACFLNPCEATCYLHGLGKGGSPSKGRKERKKTERKAKGISERHRGPPEKAPQGPSGKRLCKKINHSSIEF